MTKKIYHNLLKAYQIIISPLLGSSCRFYPSCSEYSLLAVEKHGIIKGTLKTIKRVLKCNKFNKGGIDLP